jgi:hypothetical protein
VDARLFPRPEARPGFWFRRGAPGGERTFNVALGLVLLLFTVGWTWEIANAAENGTTTDAERLTADPFDPSSPPEAAFLLDAIVRRFGDVEELRGISGDVRVILAEPGASLELPLPDSLPSDVVTELRPVRGGKVDLGAQGVPIDSAARAPQQPGAWALTLRRGVDVEEVPDVRVLVQTPSSARVKGDIGKFHIGEWPFENGRRPPKDIYATPRGFVDVTPETVGMPVSEHFVLGDFLTKGQVDVWPKYVVMSPRLLDKL